MERVTINDVATYANVSKSTVSQYLNQRYDYMSEETKKRIKKAIKDLNYQPNILARSLRLRSTATIGVIVANILHSFSTRVTRAIEDVCSENDINVMICNADDDPEKEKKYFEILQAKQVDGIIVFPTGGNLKLYNEMNLENYPLVFVDRLVDSFSTDSVMLDNRKAVKLAVEHFVEKDFQRIGFITTSLIYNTTPRRERIEEFKKLLIAKNLPVVDSYVKSLDIPELPEELEKMFQEENPPQALLAGNDLVLMEILKFVQKNQIRIPTDLALITFDDVEYNALFNPPLTTIAQPAEEMGIKAAQLLLKKIKEREDKKVENEHKIYRFEPILIKRESC